MPDTDGAPLLGEILGEAGACQNCGGPLAGRDVGVTIFEDTGNGWEQLCTSCSGPIHSVERAEGEG